MDWHEEKIRACHTYSLSEWGKCYIENNNNKISCNLFVWPYKALLRENYQTTEKTLISFRGNNHTVKLDPDKVADQVSVGFVVDGGQGQPDQYLPCTFLIVFTKRHMNFATMPVQQSSVSFWLLSLSETIVSMPAGILSCFKTICTIKLLDPCWHRRPGTKYVKQLQ